jgi:hypothetical protein
MIRYAIMTGMLISFISFTQAQNNRSDCSPYKFHLNFRPQNGYGLVLAWNNGEEKNADNIIVPKNIYAIGISNVKIGHFGEACFADKALIEFSKSNDKIHYGLTVGGDLSAIIFVLGVQLNYTTDFSSTNVLALRPRIGLSFAGIGINVNIMLEYDFHLIKPQYDKTTNYLSEIQYTIGMFEKK